VPGRRRVDDDHVIVRARVDNAQHAEQLVDAWRREAHQLRRANRGAGAFDADGGCDLVQRVFELRTAHLQRVCRVQFPNGKIRWTAWEGARRVADFGAKHVGKRMRRIRREQEHTAVTIRPREPQRHRGGDGGLADAAFTAEEE
jgi:hypothetical protein